MPNFKDNSIFLFFCFFLVVEKTKYLTHTHTPGEGKMPNSWIHSTDFKLFLIHTHFPMWD